MITGIAIENFKGISDRVELELRPITLLFGANSAGKSTVFHALHYAREIFERHNLDADQTLSGGKYIDLGGFDGFIHGHDRSRKVTIRITVDLSESKLPTFDADFDLMGEILQLRFNSLVRKPQSTAVEISIGWSNLEGCPYIEATRIFYDDSLFAEITAEPNLRGVVVSTLVMNHPVLERVEQDSQTDAGQALPEEGDTLLSLAMAYCGEQIAPGDGQRIRLSGRGDALPSMDKPLEWDLETTPSSADEASVNRLVNQSKVAEAIVIALSDLIVGPCQLIRDQLKNFRYLGPLRETPPRNYQPPRFADPARWSSGLGAWDALHNGLDEFVQSVGSWLGDEDKLNSGYRIERRNFKEIDLADPLILKLLTGRAFDEADDDAKVSLDGIPTLSRLVIVPLGSELELRPHDVGIGISQVVPVVVTALQSGQQLLAIEQPELHLHPKLQAELGDLFIEAALGHRRHLIILETHSEHLILRLLRRIRETTDGDLPKDKLPLKPDEVAVYFVEGTPSGVNAIRLRVDETGDFIDQWPKGFFEERAKELF